MLQLEEKQIPYVIEKVRHLECPTVGQSSSQASGNQARLARSEQRGGDFCIKLQQAINVAPCSAPLSSPARPHTPHPSLQINMRCYGDKPPEFMRKVGASR